MDKKSLIKGVLLGMIIGTAGPVYSYYSYYTNVCELNVDDLEQIIENVVEDAIEDCNFQENGGYPFC